MLFKNLTARAAPRLTALRNRLVKARKMMQSPLTDCKDFISKKDLNEAKKACQNTIAELYGTKRDTISAWFKRWESEKLSGLSDLPRSGRPAKLNKEQKKGVRIL